MAQNNATTSGLLGGQTSVCRARCITRPCGKPSPGANRIRFNFTVMLPRHFDVAGIFGINNFSVKNFSRDLF
jgi:hypothetical protein